MVSKRILLLLCFLSLSAQAIDERFTAEKLIKKRYFKGSKAALLITSELVIPFKEAKTFRIQSGRNASSAWIVWVHKDGSAEEFNTKNGIPDLVRSLQKPLSSLDLKKGDIDQAKKISFGILFYLGISKKKVDCAKESETRINCNLQLLNEIEATATKLVFDSSTGKMEMKK